MSKQNQVAVKEEAPLPVVKQDIAQSMADMGISASDLVIPKLLLMQPTSEMVGDEKAKVGDVVNSQTLEILGNDKASLEIIPLKLFKTWRIMDMSVKPAKLLRTENVTSQNEKLPWEGNEDGKPIRRDFCHNFFVLLLPEVEAGEAFPAVIQFKRTSSYAGRQLSTQLFKMAALGRKAFSQTVIVSVGKEKHETNTYALFKIGKGNPTNAKGLAAAEEWSGRLAAMTYTIDEGGEVEVEREVSSSGPTVVGPSTMAEAPGDLY